jgi:three-Cys-motif partner protein
MVAVQVQPPFRSLHFIDLDGDKAQQLRRLTATYPNVNVYHGDCNHVLLSEVLPQARREDYKRALCLLDPYGLHLDWRVIHAIGHMKSVELFLNFPVMDMNRNVLWLDPCGVDPDDVARMTMFWGDETWKQIAYDGSQDLFGYPEKQSNSVIAKAFQERLRLAGGFSYVPDPLAMRNSVGAVVYYLFFASPNRIGGKIVEEIFEKYKTRGGSHGRQIAD